MRLVFLEGAKIVLVGSALGLVVGFAVVRLAASMVPALPTFDLATFMTVPAVLAAVVLFACLLPARRASRIDPMVALRRT